MAVILNSHAGCQVVKVVTSQPHCVSSSPGQFTSVSIYPAFEVEILFIIIEHLANCLVLLLWKMLKKSDNATLVFIGMSKRITNLLVTLIYSRRRK